MRGIITPLLAVAIHIATPAAAQTVRLPFSEGFDTSSPPALPAGWSTSAARDPAGDFTVTGLGAPTGTGAVISTNPTIPQWLSLPPLEVEWWRDLVLRWQERRSSTHHSTLAVEASAGPGEPFETLERVSPPEGTAPVWRAVQLPDTSWGPAGVLLRISVVGDGAGSAGTLRLDEVSVDGTPSWDLSVRIRHPLPFPETPGAPSIVTGMVRNNGFEQGREGSVECFRGIPGTDGVPLWEFLSSAGVPPLPPGDSAAVDFSIDLPPGGQVGILMVCSSEGDLVASNDSAITTIRAPAGRGSVVINEIMYDPLPGRTEYVELLNTTPDTIDVGSWRLSDTDEDSETGYLGDGVISIGPGGYIVCSAGTTVGADYPGIPPDAGIIGGVKGLTLNNGGDLLILTDREGRVVDRLEYLPSWHTPLLDDPTGRSLEKIDPSSPGEESWNWGSSPDPSGGTPGRANGLRTEPADDPTRVISCRPNPFSPDGDGFEDVTTISFTTGETGALVRVRIFTSEGRPVRTLTRSSYTGNAGSIVWNGYDDRGKKAGIGIYIVVVEGVTASGERAFLTKGTIVVGGRL